MSRIETLDLNPDDPAFLRRVAEAADAVIDARSPSEFAEDRVPGAINLPTLSDAERAEVGTVFVQVDKFEARRLGAAAAARNIAAHLDGYFAEKPAGFRPLVYCWRGGQRSRSLALVLSEVGFPVQLLAGGHRRYRTHVVRRLYQAEPWLRPMLIDGPTCVGKTEILAALARRGAPTVDLEALAAHRGSLFGGERDAQPSQKLFESRLLLALPAQTGAGIAVEAESAKIGERLLPPSLWKAMLGAPCVRIEAPLAVRAQYAASRYEAIAADRARLFELLGRLTARSGHAAVARWRAMAAAGETAALAAALFEEHYDPAYARSTAASGRRVVETIALDRLDAESFEAAADRIAAHLG